MASHGWRYRSVFKFEDVIVVMKKIICEFVDTLVNLLIDDVSSDCTVFSIKAKLLRELVTDTLSLS